MRSESESDSLMALPNSCISSLSLSSKIIPFPGTFRLAPNSCFHIQVNRAVCADGAQSTSGTTRHTRPYYSMQAVIAFTRCIGPGLGLRFDSQTALASTVHQVDPA